MLKLRLMSGVLLILASSLLAQSNAKHGGVDLTLSNFLSQVYEQNEVIQAKLLETEVARRKSKAEYGIFEPEFFGSAERVYLNRQNTVQEERSMYTDVYQEDNKIYQSGIEGLVPTGMRLRLGYTLRDLENNLQDQPSFLFRGATNGEYQSFFGLSASQPLLKNAGSAATLAGIRIAALESDIAYQEYRRQLMITLSTAEAHYWNLYLAQEQVRFFQDSLSTAEKILKDSHQRLEAGKGSQLDVLEAESGVALRKAKLSDADQKLYEAVARVLSLASQTVLTTNRLIRAVDRPQVSGSKPGFFDAWRVANELNPDYQVQRLKLTQEANRLGYARNQRLPELNLKGSYGLSGLGDSPGSSWDYLDTGAYPAWTVGVELRVPLGGGIKTANELAAAKLRYRAAEVGLRDIETQIANSLDTAMHKLQSASQGVESYQTLVNFSRNMLDAAMARLEVGRIDSRKVLEIEAELFEARNSVAEALVQYQRADLELDLVQGVMLRKRELDFTQRDLSGRTAQLMRGYGLTDEGYRTLLQDLQQERERRKPSAIIVNTPEQIKARQALDAKLAEWPATNALPATVNQDAPDPLRDALRKRIKELTP